MFDFIRYEGANYCYCPQCKAAFEKYLNETITNWPGDFTPDTGTRWFEFLEWRTIPITNIVKEGSQILRNAKPNITIGEHQSIERAAQRLTVDVGSARGPLNRRQPQ